MSRPTPRSVRRRRALAAVLVFAACLVPSVAAADEGLRLSLDWDKLGAAIHTGASSLLPHESWRSDAFDQTHGGKPESWFGTSPRLAFVARDWAVSQVLWGHLAVTDHLRLSRSSRMVVTRVRLADGVVMPFMHVGIGQWRADTSVVPALRSDPDLASQVGGGVEIELAPRMLIALEGDCTVLYREGRDAQTLSSGEFWSTLVAARARF